MKEIVEEMIEKTYKLARKSSIYHHCLSGFIEWIDWQEGRVNIDKPWKM